MDHKIEVQKKSVWGTILIILLIILIIAAVGFFMVVRLNLMQQLSRVESVASSLAVTTTRVKEGVYELKLDNITGTVRNRSFRAICRSELADKRDGFRDPRKCR